MQGAEGAALSKDLSIPHAELIIRKGFHKNADSYSAFLETDGKTSTGLAGYLRGHKIKRVFVAGLATDFCVAWTALDAQGGFEVYVVERRLPRHRHVRLSRQGLGDHGGRKADTVGGYCGKRVSCATRPSS